MKGLPFTVHIFIGPTQNNVAHSLNATSTYVGSVYNFCAPSLTRKGSCANCERQEESGAKSTGQVPITNALLRHVMLDSKPLDSLHRQQVEKYLTENLNWSITTVCEKPCSSFCNVRLRLHRLEEGKSHSTPCLPWKFSSPWGRLFITRRARCYHTIPDTRCCTQ